MWRVKWSGQRNPGRTGSGKNRRKPAQNCHFWLFFGVVRILGAADEISKNVLESPFQELSNNSSTVPGRRPGGTYYYDGTVTPAKKPLSSPLQRRTVHALHCYIQASGWFFFFNLGKKRPDLYYLSVRTNLHTLSVGGTVNSSVFRFKLPQKAYKCTSGSRDLNFELF